jgi:hypothetical protein
MVEVDCQIHALVGGDMKTRGNVFLWIDSGRSRRNLAVRKRVEAYATAIGKRSDNISLLAPNLAALRPFLKC